MPIIETIICFNSGSVGDLIKVLGLQQLGKTKYHHDDTGAISVNNYFKHWSREVFYNRNSKESLDLNQASRIENTHYWLDFYPDITKNLFYIDYPDTIQPLILDVVKKKRYNDDWGVFLNQNISNIPQKLQEKINLDNVREIFNLRWLNNLHSWRQNRFLQKIDFLDFFVLDKMIDIVIKISGHKEIDLETFQDTYLKWLDTNQELLEGIK